MTIQTKRDNNIKEALRYQGLSVLIKSESEFNHIKDFLSKDVLYLDFIPQMATKPTAIVIWSDNKDFGTASVGCANFQRDNFIRVVEFKDFFKL
jgi:hypothetical protein